MEKCLEKNCLINTYLIDLNKISLKTLQFLSRKVPILRYMPPKLVTFLDTSKQEMKTYSNIIHCMI